MKKLLLIILFITNNAIAEEVSFMEEQATKDIELIKKTNSSLTSQNLQKIYNNQLKRIKISNETTLRVLNKHCPEDVAKICNDGSTNKINCLILNSEKLSKKCSNNIKTFLGEWEPFKTPTTINNVTFPIGSYIVYRDIITKEPKVVGTINYIKINNLFFTGRFEINKDKSSIEPKGLAFPQVINGIEYSPQSAIGFYNNGIVNHSIINQDTEIQGITYKKESFLGLYPSGNVKEGQLAKKTTIYNVRLQKNSMIRFNEFRELSFFIDGPINVAGFYLLKTEYEYRVWVYPNGNLKSGVLAKPTSINGITYPEYTKILLGPDGDVIETIKIDKPIPPLKKGDKFRLSATSISIANEIEDIYSPEKTKTKHKYSRISSINSFLTGPKYDYPETYIDRVLFSGTELEIIKKLKENVFLIKDENGNIYRKYIFGNNPVSASDKCSMRSFYKCGYWNESIIKCLDKKYNISIKFENLINTDYSKKYLEKIESNRNSFSNETGIMLNQPISTPRQSLNVTGLQIANILLRKDYLRIDHIKLNKLK